MGAGLCVSCAAGGTPAFNSLIFSHLQHMAVVVGLEEKCIREPRSNTRLAVLTADLLCLLLLHICFSICILELPSWPHFKQHGPGIRLDSHLRAFLLQLCRDGRDLSELCVGTDLGLSLLLGLHVAVLLSLELKWGFLAVMSVSVGAVCAGAAPHGGAYRDFIQAWNHRTSEAGEALQGPQPTPHPHSSGW